MAHWSEGSQPLEVTRASLHNLKELTDCITDGPEVLLLWLPPSRGMEVSACAQEAYGRIAKAMERLSRQAVVCILTTPPDAALLLPYLESALKFQLWVAVKTQAEEQAAQNGALPQSHAALLALSRYRHALRHTKTRIQYTYCPACGKTTKDYGGKKHTYHEYGTLMADVWRDIACDPARDIAAVVERLRDVFGLEPHIRLRVLDMRSCVELQSRRPAESVRETRLPLEWEADKVPAESQLIQGDCLEILKTLPESSVDFAFADPPYNLQKKYDRWNDALESIEYFAWCDRWLTELERVLKPGRTLAVLNIPLWAVRHFQHLGKRMRFQSWIVWEALGFPVRMIMPAHYAILCFSKGGPRPLPGLAHAASAESAFLSPQEENFCLRASCVAKRRQSSSTDRARLTDLWSDIHRLKHNSRRVDHPCQLPPMLMRRLFALYTHPGETILDCFNGSGTSTLTAQQMQRRFVGIELSEQYHRLALLRHQQLACGVDPFGKDETVPEAKNSRVQRMPKQRYAVSKKTLQLEVKRIAHQLGKLPTREEVEALGRYPIAYYEQYFASWGEACAAARTTGMSELPASSSSLPASQPALSLELESSP